MSSGVVKMAGTGGVYTSYANTDQTAINNPQTFNQSINIQTPGNHGVHDTENRVTHVVRPNLVNFSNIETSGTIGATSNPGYTFGRMNASTGSDTTGGLSDRGPLTSDNGAALAYTNFHPISSASWTRQYRWASTQVWIGFSGEMQLAMMNGTLTRLDMDFFFGLGALSDETYANNATGITRTFFDLSFNRVTNISAQPSREITEFNTVPLETPGDIYAGTRAINQVAWGGHNRALNDTRSSRAVSRGLTRGLTSYHRSSSNYNNHIHGNHWGFHEYTDIRIMNPNVIQRIGNQGGFWLRLYSFAHSHSGGVRSYFAQVANVFEGMNWRATFADKDMNFRSGNQNLGIVDHPWINYYEGTSNPNQTFNSNAIANANNMFVNWTSRTCQLGLQGTSSDPKNPHATSRSYLESARAHQIVTANFAPIPVTGENLYVFNGQPQSPLVDLAQINTVVDRQHRIEQTFTGRNNTEFNSENRPVDAGDYTYVARVYRQVGTPRGMEWVFVGEAIRDFTIATATLDQGTLGISLLGWVWGNIPNIPALIGTLPSITGTYTFEYQHYQNGEWSSEVPQTIGVHNVRAVFTSPNWETYIIQHVPFIISPRTVTQNEFEIILSATQIEYNANTQLPEVIITTTLREVSYTYSVDICSPIDANLGTRTITITLVFTGNYQGIFQVMKTIEIIPMPESGGEETEGDNDLATGDKDDNIDNNIDTNDKESGEEEVEDETTYEGYSNGTKVPTGAVAGGVAAGGVTALGIFGHIVKSRRIF